MTHHLKEPCIRCGALISSSHAVSLRTVTQLSKAAPSEYVDKIVEAEGVAKDVAQEFVDHKMHLDCIKCEPPCPQCGAPLKTWHAVHCLKCDWVRDEGKQLLEYYQ